MRQALGFFGGELRITMREILMMPAKCYDPRRLILSLTTAAAIACSLASANAAVVVWTGTGTNDFNTLANWTGGLPSSANDADFTGVGTIFNPTVSANITANGLRFDGATPYVLDVGAFVLTEDGGNFDLTTVTGDHSIVSSAPATGRLALAGAHSLIASGTSTLTISAPLANSGAALRTTKLGTGRLIIANDNTATYLQSTGSTGNSATAGRHAWSVVEGELEFAVAGAKGQTSNSIRVYTGTLRLSANYGDITTFAGAGNLERGDLTLAGTGSSGQGALFNVSGDNAITKAAADNGVVRFAEDVDDVPVRIGVAGSSSLTISETIIDGPIQGALAANFEKTGTGRLVFDTSTHTYTGNTLVNAGELIINSNYTGGGAFSVDSNAILGGSGNLGTSAVTVNAGGFLTPGASIGTLAVGGASILGTLGIEYNGDSSAIDMLNVAGGMDISAATVDFLNLGSAELAPGNYVFATYANLIGEFASANIPTGFDIDYTYQGNSIALVAVPEPSSIALIGIGFLACAKCLRRGRSKCGS